MQTGQKQGGMTAISTLLLLIIAGFFVLLLLKLGPIYLDNYKVKSVLASLESQPELTSLSPRKIRAAISKRLFINEVLHLDDKDIKLKRVGDNLQVHIDYEVREKILANVEAVVIFHEQAELKSR